MYASNTNFYFVPIEVPDEYCFNSNSTFAEYAEVWIEENTNILAIKTIARYRDLLKRINMGIGHIPLKDIQPYHLRQFLNKISQYGVNKRTGKCLSEKTILHHYRLISVILQQAVRDRLISYNPACKDRMKAPRVTRNEITVLQCNEYQKLISILTLDREIDIRMKTAILLMALTGLRRGEAAGLEFGDLQEGNDLLTIRRAILYTPEKGVFQKEPKTKSSYRTFLISPWVKSIIEDYKVWYQDTYSVRGNLLRKRKLFCQEDGKPIHPDTLTIWCRKFCNRNPSIPRFTPHILRHTYASMLISLGISMKEVSSRLGHSMLTTTCNTYTHSMQFADRRAAEALDQFKII